MNQESVMKRTTTDFGLPTLEEVEEISNSNKKAPDFREDQAFIIHSLKDFDDQIQKHKTETYVLAESLNKLYVENPKFRLMFLRANNFDKAAATCRLMEFLDQKLTYFGKDRLTKEITLNDLSTEDMKALESGMFQELSSLDVIGRPIVALFQQLRRFDKPKNMLRALFYGFMTIAKEYPKAQKDGIVIVYYNPSETPVKPFPSVAKSCWALQISLPIKIAACHICLRCEDTQTFCSFNIEKPKFDRKIPTKFTFGTDMDCQFTLEQQGIPIESFPIYAGSGEINLHCHKQWIEKRMALEAPPMTDMESPTVSSVREVAAKNPALGAFLLSSFAKRSPLNLVTPYSSLLLPEASAYSPNSSLLQLLNSGVNPSASLRGLPIAYAGPSDPLLLRQRQLQFANSLFSSGPSYPIIQSVVPSSLQHRSPQKRKVSNEDGSLPRDIPKGLSQSDAITVTATNDILFGRGRPIQNHPGNIQLRVLLEAHASTYDEAPKHIKSLLVEDLVKSISESGARFLKPAFDRQNKEDGWEEVDPKEAHKKVSQCFRTMRGNALRKAAARQKLILERMNL